MSDDDADLHSHSSESDGTVRPKVLVRLAAEAGLTFLALTDHDTIGGLSEAAGALPRGLTLVPGAELSCSLKVNGRLRTVHVLAYLFDREDRALGEVMGRVRADRERRAREMVKKLAEDGHRVTWDAVEALAGTGSVGKPAIAQALVNAEVLPTIEAAWTPQWLDSGGRYHVSKWQPDAVDAIGLVRAAGGVAVLAHPLRKDRGGVLTDQHLAMLAAAGLFGLEVFHPEHDADQQRRLRGLAADLGVEATGGSDYHGDRKRQGLGAYRTSREVVERLIAAASGATPIRG
ncbi:PHP domain-containing protein [Frankia sp. AiPs1]|uniref:PHP domain-containing protein n=1 Tax=Frankia sp. AiPs1 TaxID=573493 RepID=UPI0020432A4F|nr:PHP domain-containing protein [Frankia sp. AiPs1]MCM3920320.1 PHP domain-containing protein [Frankia sp. AiPs1]